MLRVRVLLSVILLASTIESRAAETPQVTVPSTAGEIGLVVAASAPLPGYSSTIIHVKFHRGTQTRSPELLLPPELRKSVASINRLFSALPQSKLDEMKARGEYRSGETLPDMNLWFTITLRAGTNANDVLERLRRLPFVETAELAPSPAPPPQATPDYTSKQGYLDRYRYFEYGVPLEYLPPGYGEQWATATGIDARYAWTVPGGNGAGVRIYDVEYSWNQNHEDLSKAKGLPLLLDPGDVAFDPFGNDYHGTAALGVLVADNDTKGVTGISWGADVGLAPAATQHHGYNPANAILLAAANGKAGDIILIEQQYWVCGGSSDFDYGPIEWIQTVFDAIKLAVANGIAVVEPAGNGGVNLDKPSCAGMFDRTVRDSGAIVVGQSLDVWGDRVATGRSSFGSRVDVQGWGLAVWSTGPSFCPPNDPNENRCYTSSFSGTSSASAIVAGAVADLQGIAIQMFGAPFSPAELRTLLTQTGNAQLGDTSRHIGPLPDLWRAVGQLTTVLNSMVSFVPIGSSYSTTSSTTGCPTGYVGKFSFNARLTNSYTSPALSALMAKVNVLSNGNLLQNADFGPAGVGATLTVANAGSFSDGLLSPNEFVDVPFSICLKNTKSFNFFVDVLGIEAGVSSNSLVMK